MENLERLTHAGVRVAVAESLTSGLLCSEVGKSNDASSWFTGGVIAYATRVKEDLLGLTPGTDPCSVACAEQLAAGVRSLLHADVAVSTTGVGGPEPEDDHEPGTVYLGWATASGAGHRLLHLRGEPEQVLQDTVALALGLLADLAEPAASIASLRSPARNEPGVPKGHPPR